MKVLKRVLKWMTGAILVLLLAFLLGFIAYWRSTNDCDRTTAPTSPMKAIVYCDYGLANLKLVDVENQRQLTINSWSEFAPHRSIRTTGISLKARLTSCVRWVLG